MPCCCYPQVASLRAQLTLSEQRGDDWKERAEKANPQVEKLKQVEALREEEAAVLKGEREENETLKTRLHEAEEELAATRVARDDARRASAVKDQTIARLEADLKAQTEEEAAALQQQRDRNFELEKEAAEQRYSIRLLKESAAARWRPVWVWLFGAGVGLIFGTTWPWG